MKKETKSKKSGKKKLDPNDDKLICGGKDMTYNNLIKRVNKLK